MNTSTAEANTPEQSSSPDSGSLHWTESVVIEVNADSPKALLRVNDTRVFSAQRDVLHLRSAADIHLQRFAESQIAEARNAFERAPNNALLANNLAAAYLLSGAPEQAVAILEPFRDQSSPNVNQTLARAKAASGNLDEALELYRATIEAEPTSIELRLEYAGVLFNNGDIEASRRAYEETLNIDPSNAWAANNLGILRATSSDVRGAVRSFRTAIRGHERFAVAYNNLGLCLARVGQLEKAVQHFQTAIRLVPTYRGAYFNLAHGLIRTEKHSEAELILRAARKRFPDDPQLADLLSDVLMAQGRWKDSAVLFGEILGRFGQSYSRLINVGVAFSRLGKDANAEDAWRLAVALDPKQHHGSYNLIWLFLRTGRHDEAKNVYDAAMLKLPRSETETSEVEAIFANSLMQQGRFVEGEALLRERIARGHADASVFSTLSVLLGDYLGRYREAAEVCEVGLEAHPDVWRLGNSLAYALLMAGEIERANSVLQRYTRHVGVDPYFTATRGLYFLRRGYQERGVALYRKAVALAPSAHKARIRQKLELELGRWFFDGGDVKLAKPHLKRAVDLGVDKSFTLQARELLARL